MAQVTIKSQVSVNHGGGEETKKKVWHMALAKTVAMIQN